MKTIARVFQEAFALISNPDTFMRYALAGRADGQPCNTVRAPEAVRFCSMGALIHVDEMYPTKIFYALNEAMGFDVVKFNNTHPHEEVVAAWQLAGLTHGWLEATAKEEAHA